jgi:hypothetical protein
MIGDNPVAKSGVESLGIRGKGPGVRVHRKTGRNGCSTPFFDLLGKFQRLATVTARSGGNRDKAYCNNCRHITKEY